MNFLKNFALFALVVSCTALFSAFTRPTAAPAGTMKIQMNVDPSAAAYIKFDGIDGECTVKEGRNTVGQNTRTGDKLVVIIRDGKLAGFGLQPKSGAFKTLSPNSAPCNPTLTCTTFNPPKCYTLPSGECVCACGPWITSNTGRN